MKVWVMLCAVCAGAAAHARIAHASLATPRAARANTLAGRATTSERRRVRAVTLRGGSGGEIYSFLGALDLMGTARRPRGKLRRAIVDDFVEPPSGFSPAKPAAAPRGARGPAMKRRQGAASRDG